MTRRDTALVLVVALVWGVNFAVIERGMVGVPPLLFLAIRFVVVVLPAIWFVPRPDASWSTLIRVGGLMSLGQFGFLYLSLHVGMPPGLAALVLQAQVVLTILIAAGVLGERPSVRQMIGVLLGSVGLGIVALSVALDAPGNAAATPLIALLLCLAAALSWAAGNVAARASGVRGGLSLTVWSAVVVPVPAFGLALLVDGPAAVLDGLAAFGWAAAASTLYTAVLASLVGYGIFNSLLGRYAAGQVVPWILLVPVVGMASAWALLGERPSTGEVIGGAVLLSGALLAQLPGRRRRGRTGGAAGDPDGEGGGDQRAMPDSVYVEPPPARFARAASTRRVVKSAQRSATSSGVQNAMPLISRSSRTT